MKVSDVWKTLGHADMIDANGAPKKNDPDMLNGITKIANGDFSNFSFFQLNVEMPAVGLNKQNLQLMSRDMLNVINKDFGGKPSAGISFLKGVQGSNLGKLDFDQLAQNGDVDRLVQLQKTNPSGFTRLLAGNYPDANALTTALNTAAAPGSAAPPAIAASPATKAPLAPRRPAPSPS